MQQELQNDLNTLESADLFLQYEVEVAERVQEATETDLKIIRMAKAQWLRNLKEGKIDLTKPEHYETLVKMEQRLLKGEL